MKKKRQKSKELSKLINEKIKYYFYISGYEITMPDWEWADICDDMADDIIAMLDDMEDEEK